MSAEDTFNCNSRRLCNAVKSLLALSSMSDAFWIMARDKPCEFVQFVEENLTEIQGEFEKHFKTTAVFPRFIRQNEKTDIRTGQTFTNKIGFIKMIRTLSCVRGVGNGWGLADSKNFVETLPKDYRMFFFHSEQEALGSKFARCCTEMGIEVQWVPTDSTDGLIHYDDHQHKDMY